EQGPESLVECVLRQIDLTIFDPHQRVIAYALSEALEPTGWLGRELSDIAVACGADETEVEEVLALVQRLEPEGVFARSLAECLQIQARERGVLDPVMTVVLDNLQMLANGDIAQLARRADATTEDVSRCLKLIREFNPKPGEAYEAAPLRVHAPDVIVTKGPDGWVVDLNRSTLPALVINEAYAAEIGEAARGKAAEAGAQFASEALGSARWLRRALEQRNSTTLKIAGEIVRQQAAFLTEGLSALKPLALKDVAEAVGMHESTVSRVTSGLLMATPKGCFPLKSLFSVSLATDEGDARAAAAVRNMIEAIVKSEPAGKPLSDDAIAKMVSGQGVKLARRTVAKYREMLKIPSSSERRRRARLAMVG
ncbi:MAG: RNA polymerase factor sigma-54, partial [Pseudomonadota bacterium]|nr:RNA polymerase factor sigma-54 [Pseudomonadota bacterium]